MASQVSGSSSETIVRRVLRGSAWMTLGILSSQGIRLGANLILTRLLFPEAFGLMALVSVFIVGMTMFSDMGIRPWIQQNKMGDDPLYLDTAWTIQVARGLVLCVITYSLAWPVATFYGEPLLAKILPIAGLELLILGFMPTRVGTAFRHLLVGKVTLFQLISQLIGVIIIVLLAWQMQSVWALVFGGLASSLVLVLMMQFGLPGHVNRLRFDGAAAAEIVSFGKWIFASTICGFLMAQGDKIILGKYFTIETLGIYTIGFFLASFPVLLAEKVTRKVLIPLYRERPPGQSTDNFLKIRRLRFGVTGGIFVLLIALSLLGPLIVDILYDARYRQSGIILVLVACAQMPLLIGLTYNHAALASGDSRQFFVVAATRAVVMMTLMLLGTYYYGVVGTIAGQGLAYLLTLPVTIWLARSHNAWDRLHDTSFLLIMLFFGGAALWLHRDGISELVKNGVLG